MRQVVEIFVVFTGKTPHEHPHLQAALRNYKALARAQGRNDDDIISTIVALAEPLRRQSL